MHYILGDPASIALQRRVMCCKWQLRALAGPQLGAAVLPLCSCCHKLCVQPVAYCDCSWSVCVSVMNDVVLLQQQDALLVPCVGRHVCKD